MTLRARFIVCVAAGALLAGPLAVGLFGGYRFNLTPSEPLGLWRIAPLNRPVVAGDLVFICPPPKPVFSNAFKRGYLRRGICPDGFAPLLKSVAALPGQSIKIGDHVIIDGHRLDASRIRKSDGDGRTIMPFAGGIVLARHLFLHSSFASSYDSRYFGPVPDSGLLGFARPILTFEP